MAPLNSVLSASAPGTLPSAVGFCSADMMEELGDRISGGDEDEGGRMRGQRGERRTRGDGWEWEEMGEGEEGS